MNNNGAVSVGETPKYRFLLLSLLLIALIPCVSAININADTHIDTTNATPFSLWAAAGIIGIVLFLLTLKTRTLASELEADAIISVVSWIPIAFTAYTSFAVDRIVSSFAVPAGTTYTIIEDHVIYHFNIVAIVYGILLLISIINTLRIISLHKAFRIRDESQALGD